MLGKVHVGQSIRFGVVVIGQVLDLALVNVEDQVFFLDLVVHHLHLALRVPDLLLNAHEKGVWALERLRHLLRQVGDQRVIPFKRRHEGDERLHQNGHVRNVLFDHDDLFLQQQRSDQLHDLVDVVDFYEQPLEPIVLNPELFGRLVSIPQDQLLSGRENELNGALDVFLKIQVLEEHGTNELKTLILSLELGLLDLGDALGPNDGVINELQSILHGVDEGL